MRIRKILIRKILSDTFIYPFSPLWDFFQDEKNKFYDLEISQKESENYGNFTYTFLNNLITNE